MNETIRSCSIHGELRENSFRLLIRGAELRDAYRVGKGWRHSLSQIYYYIVVSTVA